MWTVTRRFLLGAGEMCLIIRANCSAGTMKNLHPSNAYFQNTTFILLFLFETLVTFMLFTVVPYAFGWMQSRKKAFSYLVLCFAPGHLFD